MKKTFSGPATGPGSKLAWDGNSDVGAGTLTIADATAPSKVVLKLDMTRPMEGPQHHRIRPHAGRRRHQDDTGACTGR